MSGSQNATGGQQDIANLGFAVDTSQVVTARQDLDQLKSSSDKLAESQDNLTQRVQRFLAVANGVSESTAQMRRQFQDASQSLDGMIAMLDNARARVDGTAASFAALAAAQGQVAALGQSFGVTSSAMEAFTEQSQVLGLSAAQTTLALQRITEALNNQTIAGQAVRQQIQGLGVDLAGLSANDSAGVLASVVARLRATQDGIGKYQTESGILGITDPQTLQQLNTPTYVPTAQRLGLQRQMEADRQIGQTTQLVAGDQRQMGNDDAEYADLSSQYTLSRFGIFAGLSGAQRAQLAAAVGLPTTTGFNTQNDQLVGMRYLAAHPDSDMANSARYVGTSIGRDFDQSYLGGAFRHLTDGTYSSNLADIQDQYEQDSRNSRFGAFGAFWTGEGRSIENAFNLYTPRKPLDDSRPIDGDTAIRTDQAAAQQLEGFGDDSLSNYQSIAGSIRRLQDPSALANYTRAYGQQEGQARYYGTLSGLQRDQATSLVTGGAQIQDLQQQQWLLGVSQQQRPEAEALLKFMGSLSDQKGNIPALWSGSSPMSISDILNPDGTSGGPGVLTQQETQAFQKIQQLQRANAQNSNDQAFDQRIGDDRQITAASAISPAAVQDTTTALQAYNDAIAKQLDPVKAMAQAESELAEKRKAAGAALLSNLDFQNQQSASKLAASTGAAPDLLSQGAASYGASIAADYDKIRRDGSATLSEDAYTAARRRSLGIEGEQFGQSQVVSAQQGLADAGAAALGSAGTQAQQAEATFKTFADALAKAKVAGGDATTQLESLIEKVMQLGQQAERVRFDGQTWQQTQGNLRSAAWDTAIANAPADQRPLLRAQQGALDQAYQAGNPALMGLSNRPQLGASDIDMVTQLATSLGVSPGLAMMIAQQEGGGNSSLANMFQVSAGTLPQAMSYLQGQPGWNGVTPNINTRQGSAVAGIGYLGYLNSLPGFTGNLPGIAAGYNAGPANPGVQAFVGSGDTNVAALPSVTQAYVAPFQPSPSDLMARARANPPLAALLNSIGVQQSAATQGQIADEQSAAQPRDAIEAKLLALLTSGQTGAASLLQAGLNTNPQNPALGAADAQIRLRQQQQQLAEQGASQVGQTDQDIQANEKLAAAYTQGTDAVLKANASLQAHKEALAGTLGPLTEAQRASQLYTDALSKQDAALKQLLKKDQDQISLNEQAANLPIMPADQRSRALDQAAAYQNIDNTYTNPEQNAQAKASYDAVAASKEAAQGAQAANDAFADMGKTIFNTFETATFSGERFKRVLGELLESIAQIIEKLLIEKPLENAISNGFGGVFGSSVNGAANGASGGMFGNLGGGIFTSSGGGAGSLAQIGSATFGGEGAADAAGGWAGSVAQIGSDFFAAGGVFGPQGQIRMHATGSVLNGPTPFSGADGSSNIMGEARPEGILPLVTLADGSLGVMSGGGAGGNTTIVHTPITIQGGGGGAGGGLDPQAVAQIQAQINKAATEAVKSTILNQQRPGGMLFGSVPP